MITQTKKMNKKIKLKINDDLIIICSLDKIIDFDFDMVCEGKKIKVYYVIINLFDKENSDKIYISKKEFNKIKKIIESIYKIKKTDNLYPLL